MEPGDKCALDEVTPLVYEDLRLLSRCYLQDEHPAHALQSTALVHEDYSDCGDNMIRNEVAEPASLPSQKISPECGL